MTIDKAIKALEDLYGLVDEDSEINHMDAIKLGIEALRKWKEARELILCTLNPLLPGETEE